MTLAAIPIETAGDDSPPLVRLLFDIAPKGDRGPCTLCLEIHAGRMDTQDQALAVEMLSQMAREPHRRDELLERLWGLEEVIAHAMVASQHNGSGEWPLTMRNAAELAKDLSEAGWVIELEVVNVDGQPMHGDPITGTSYVEGID